MRWRKVESGNQERQRLRSSGVLRQKCPASMPADRFKAYRDRKRGGPPRTLALCGTVAAVRRHERAGEPLDDACREARRAHNARQYRARKG